MTILRGAIGQRGENGSKSAAGGRANLSPAIGGEERPLLPHHACVGRLQLNAAANSARV